MWDNSFSKLLGLLLLLAGAALLLGGGPIIGLLLGVVGFAVLGVVLLVGLVVFLAFKGMKKKPAAKENTAKKNTAEQKNPKQANGTDTGSNEVLNKGRRSVMELRMLTVKIKNMEVRKISEEICNTAESILKELKEQPEDIRKVRQFLNYYLPTLGSILTKYIRLEQSDMPTVEITEKTLIHLREIYAAMQKQYENLFADDILDLSVEMEALTQACKRDGLLGEEFHLHDGEREIKLTL